MANANLSNRNRVVAVAGVEPSPQASGNMIASGLYGVVSISGQLMFKTPAESYLPIVGEATGVPVDLASTRSGNIIVRQSLGAPGVIARADFQYTKMPTVASSGKACTVQIGIGSGSASGGVVTLTYLSGAALQAQRVSATAFTGGNAFASGQEVTATISTETNSSFADGAGVLTLYYGPPA